ncbi:MAG: hypothetical protein Q7R52_02895 [archaeon]|nr:hypothetical protein [archaeon]
MVNFFGLGNAKGELIRCSQCERWHDILRGTFCYCACGRVVQSKENKKWNENR